MGGGPVLGNRDIPRVLSPSLGPEVPGGDTSGWHVADGAVNPQCPTQSQNHPGWKRRPGLNPSCAPSQSSECHLPGWTPQTSLPISDHTSRKESPRILPNTFPQLYPLAQCSHRFVLPVPLGTATVPAGGGGNWQREQETRQDTSTGDSGHKLQQELISPPSLPEFLPPVQRRKVDCPLCRARQHLSLPGTGISPQSLPISFWFPLSLSFSSSLRSPRGAPAALPINPLLRQLPRLIHQHRASAASWAIWGPNQPVWRLCHIFSISSPFVPCLWRTKAGAG